MTGGEPAERQNFRDRAPQPGGRNAAVAEGGGRTNTRYQRVQWRRWVLLLGPTATAGRNGSVSPCAQGVLHAGPGLRPCIHL